ncbi:MAG: VOC family protein [Methanobacterium sp.]|nr:VOC family protein [Methanobacterium sp.]
MQRIVTFLTFKDKAEEAVKFYTTLFTNSQILDTTYYGEEGPGPAGSVLSVTFQLDGQEYIAMNGGPYFEFNPSVSLFVKCETQGEIDRLWEKLSLDGEEQGPGWVRDKFGLSWQIVPTVLGEYLSDPDQEKSQRVMNAMLQMNKLDIEQLKQAYERK